MNQISVFFSLTLELAEQAKSICKPNPAVGAIVVKQGKILSVGYTQPVGRNHAEVEAIKKLSKRQSKDSELYVSLMPCAFQGNTPPCTDAIINSGIKHVHIALFDNDPRMKKTKGLYLTEKLFRAHKIKVSYDCPLEISKKLFYLNWDYYKKNATGLPSFTLKYAMSADGKIAGAKKLLSPTTTASKSKPLSNYRDRILLSNQSSLAQVHKERAQHQAVLIGGNTLINDNPQLNVRNTRISKAQQQKIAININNYTSGIALPNSIFPTTSILQQPTPIVLTRSNLSKKISAKNTRNNSFYHLLHSPLNPIPCFIIPHTLRSVYQELPHPRKLYLWSTNKKIRPLPPLPPTENQIEFFSSSPLTKQFWCDFSQHSKLHAIYVEGGSELHYLLYQVGLFDRVSIYFTPKFLFDGTANLSPFTPSLTSLSSKLKKSSLLTPTMLWQTDFTLLDDNILMRGFLNRSLAEKLWKELTPTKM